MSTRRSQQKDTKEKPRSKKQQLQGKTKKKGNRHDDDDESVDSHGNIRGLIDYDYTSESSYSPSDSELSEVEEVRGRRKAAIKAEKKIKKVIEKETKETKETKANGGCGIKKQKLEKGNSLITSMRRKLVVESSSEEEESEEDEEEEESEDEDSMTLEDDEEEDEDMREDEMERRGGIILTLGSSDNPMIPKRHDMKKEPEIVKKFVELLTKPLEDNSIDAQIDQFKVLTEEKQKELITALEKRPTMTDTGINLMLRILTLKLPTDIQANDSC